MGFLPGKVPTKVLEKIVFKNLGVKRDDVVLSPSIGEDAAIVKAGWVYRDIRFQGAHTVTI